MSIKATTKLGGTVGIIEIKGSLIGDGDTDQLRSIVADFLEQGIVRLVINMQKLNYLNSSGIGAVIAAHASIKKNGGEVKIAGIGGNIQNLLAVTKLIDVFDVFETVDEAISEFSKMKQPT
jgi:anti-sigma B factor antagonist